MNANEILTAPYHAFEMVNTHELKQGDIIRLYGMVIRIGEKQISDQGAHADKGHGCVHYHISEVLAIAQNSPLKDCLRMVNSGMYKAISWQCGQNTKVNHYSPSQKRGFL